MAFNIKKAFLTWAGAVSKEETDLRVTQLQNKIENQKKSIEDLKNYTTSTEPSALAIEADDKETTQASGIRVNPVLLQKTYFNNQYIFRAVNIRANELVTRGYKLLDGDEEGRKKCEELIEKSGNESFLKQWSVNTDIWGTSWLEKNYSKDGTEIKKLSFIHPATFGWKTKGEHFNILEIGPDNQPVACQQKTIDENGAEKIIEVDKSKIEYLTFNKVADEFIGVGIIQPIYNTISRLMAMEGAAARAAVKAANPVWVGVFDTVSEHTVRKWAHVLGRLSTKEQIFLPKGTSIDLISPERQLFSEYSEYYVDSIIAGTGVPKSLLLGRSGDTNRAESIVHSRHFQSLIESNQTSMEYVINKIFKEYGKIANFEPPKFVFNEILEDANVVADKAIKLFEVGLLTRDEARSMLGLEESNNNDSFNRSTKKDMNEQIKESEMKTWHPSRPGSPEGSQKNNKRDAKNDIANASSPK